MLFLLSWTVRFRYVSMEKARSGLNTDKCQDSYLDVINYTLELLH